MKGKYALVTGTSSGIGAALAHEFARNGYNIIAVAPAIEDLINISAEIKEQHEVEVRSFAKDLARDNAARELYDEIKVSELPVDVLVNDAGIGQSGAFVDIPFENDEEIIHLNIIALVHLTKLFLRDMVARDDGKILQLGSIAGFQPGPLMAVYHASKAFIVSFSEAIATELEDANVNVTITCLCPGPTDTNFFSRANLEHSRVVEQKEWTMQTAEQVAKSGYEALMNGERIHVPGTANKILTFTRRVIPKSVQASVQKGFYESSQE